MDNWSPLQNILLLFGIISVIFLFIYLLDRQIKTHGTLFTQQPTKGSRLLAFIIGIFLAGAFVIIWKVEYFLSFETILLGLAAIMCFAYSIGFDRPLTEMQKNYPDMLHRPRPGDAKKIIGIDKMSLNEMVFNISAGARFVIFEYCISLLVVTLRYDSNIFFIEPGGDPMKKAWPYILVSFLFGWFSILGPINTLRSLKTDFKGGRDVTKPVSEWIKWRYEQDQVQRTLSQSSEPVD